MDKEMKQAIAGALVGVRGVDNAIIPNIVEILASADSPEDAKITLAGSSEVRGLNPQIIPNIISAVKGVLAKGPAPKKKEEKEEAEEVDTGKMSDAERKAKILEAVTECMDVGDEEELTGSGIPKVGVIEDMVGFDITAAERDDAAAEYAEKNA